MHGATSRGLLTESWQSHGRSISHKDKALPPGLREAHSCPPLEAGIFGLRKLTTLPRHGSYAKRFRTQTVYGSLGEDWPCRWLLLSLGVGDQALYLRLKQL